MRHEHDEDGYAGPARLLVDTHELHVTVQLGGYFQPLNGRYAWYGRVDSSAELSDLLSGNAAAVLLTPFGRADATLSDPDLWGRYRIHGTSTPPFHVPTSIEEADAAAGGDR